MPSPTPVSSPGLPAAVPRSRCDRTPCGRQYASIRPSDAARAAPERDPGRTDRAPDQLFARKAIEPAGAAIPVPRRTQRQIARAAGLAEALRERNEQLLGNGNPHEPPGPPTCPIHDQLGSRLGRDDLPAPPSRHGATLSDPTRRPLVGVFGLEPHHAGQLPTEPVLAPKFAYLPATERGRPRRAHHPRRCRDDRGEPSPEQQPQREVQEARRLAYSALWRKPADAIMGQ